MLSARGLVAAGLAVAALGAHAALMAGIFVLRIGVSVSLPWWVALAGPAVLYPFLCLVSLPRVGFATRLGVVGALYGTYGLVAGLTGLLVAGLTGLPYATAVMQASLGFLPAPLLQLFSVAMTLRPFRGLVVPPPPRGRRDRAPRREAAVERNRPRHEAVPGWEATPLLDAVRPEARMTAAPPIPPPPAVVTRAVAPDAPVTVVSAAEEPAPPAVVAAPAVTAPDPAPAAVTEPVIEPPSATVATPAAEPATMPESSTARAEDVVAVAFGRLVDQLPAELFALPLDAVGARLAEPGHLLIPQRVVLSQLAEGVVTAAWNEVVGQFPADVFKGTPAAVGERLHDGRLLLPLDELVMRLPADVFSMPTAAVDTAALESFPLPFQPVGLGDAADARPAPEAIPIAATREEQAPAAVVAAAPPLGGAAPVSVEDAAAEEAPEPGVAQVPVAEAPEPAIETQERVVALPAQMMAMPATEEPVAEPVGPAATPVAVATPAPVVAPPVFVAATPDPVTAAPAFAEAPPAPVAEEAIASAAEPVVAPVVPMVAALAPEEPAAEPVVPAAAPVAVATPVPVAAEPATVVAPPAPVDEDAVVATAEPVVTEASAFVVPAFDAAPVSSLATTPRSPALPATGGDERLLAGLGGALAPVGPLVSSVSALPGMGLYVFRAPALPLAGILRAVGPVLPLVTEGPWAVEQITLRLESSAVVLTPLPGEGADAGLLVATPLRAGSLALLEILSLRARAARSRTPRPPRDAMVLEELIPVAGGPAADLLAGALGAVGAFAPTVLRDAAGRVELCLLLPPGEDSRGVGALAHAACLALAAAGDDSGLGPVQAAVFRVGGRRLALRPMEGRPGHWIAILTAGEGARPGQLAREMERATARVGAR